MYCKSLPRDAQEKRIGMPEYLISQAICAHRYKASTKATLKPCTKTSASAEEARRTISNQSSFLRTSHPSAVKCRLGSVLCFHSVRWKILSSKGNGTVPI